MGYRTKYNGGSNPHELLMKYEKRGQFIAICPEALAQLALPRPPAEIRNGEGRAVLLGTAQVVDRDGNEITEQFINGARKVLQLAQNDQIKYAILKERSPSCGVQQIYDGHFSHTPREGAGVCTVLLMQQGIRCFSEETVTEDLLEEILRRRY